MSRPLTTKQPRFSVAIKSDAYSRLINDTLGDPKVARNFVANISTVVGNDPALQTATPSSIVSAGLMAESLQLSLSKMLGYAYLVPYDTKNGRQAQFQIGYKGYIQLAIRTGQYQRIGTNVIRDGEYKGRDKITGEPIFEFDDTEQLDKKVIGYHAYFTMTNGFTKTLYWSKEQMEKHATRYSKAYKNKSSSSNLWRDDFDGMALKTMLRQLLSKWGLMSVELQKAYDSDMAIMDTDGSKTYVDNDTGEVEFVDAETTNITSRVEIPTEIADEIADNDTNDTFVDAKTTKDEPSTKPKGVKNKVSVKDTTTPKDTENAEKKEQTVKTPSEETPMTYDEYRAMLEKEKQDNK